MLVLHTAVLTEATGMQGGIPFVVVAVEHHERQTVAQADAYCVQCSHGTIAVDGRLTRNAYQPVRVAIVQTGIAEVVALGGIAAVERALLLWLKRTVQVGIHHVGIDVERSLAVTHTAACLGGMRVVLLGRLRWGAVVVVPQQCACRPVAVECGIQRSVGDEGRGLPPLTEAHRGGCSVHVVGGRPRRVGRQRMGASTQRL